MRTRRPGGDHQSSMRRLSSATLLVLGLAIVSSAVSIRNGFAFDDVHIIVNNERVHSLWNAWKMFGQTYWPPSEGASLYRPLTCVLFAVQWALGNGSPVPFHLLNVMLYAGLCFAVLELGRRMMDEPSAVVGAAVFAVHPVHVESVANVVGQAELWVALLLVLSLVYFLDARKSALGPRQLSVMSLLYATALLFKENAVILPGLLVAAEVLLPQPGAKTLRARLKSMLPLLVSLTIVAVVFVAVRTAVLGRFEGASTTIVLSGQSYSARVFTMLMVLPEWVRLLLWPAHLSADYSPPRIDTATSFELAMLPGLIAVAAACFVVIRVRRKHPAIACLSALTAISLLIPSNLIVVTGFILAERSLLIASVGVSLVIGYGAIQLVAKSQNSIVRQAMRVSIAGLLIAGVVKSASRSVVWKDNETLFRQTVLDVPLSYRAHLMLGELLTDAGNPQGLDELEAAVKLSRPADFFVRWFAADRFHAAGRLAEASGYYRMALAIKPADGQALYGLAACLVALGDRPGAHSVAVEGLKRNPGEVRLARLLRELEVSPLAGAG